MKKLEIYQLQKAGLSNKQILNIMRYEEIHERELSLRDRVIISEHTKPSQVLENYKALDMEAVQEEFERFPSFSIEEDIYPDELLEIYNPPVLLFYQGDLSLLREKKLAVVGSRKASTYGVKATRSLVSQVARHLVIVSGLAKGIDTCSHFTALKNGGKTIAVIGTGLDQYYPKENKELQDFIAKHHLLLSEYGPGQQALRFHFPERNRIIAGLSEAVLVTEAKKRSGSLITCERALEEGRDVFAVPGSIFSEHSEGCHHLIEEGAFSISSGNQILSLLR